MDTDVLIVGNQSKTVILVLCHYGADARPASHGPWTPAPQVQ